VGRKFRCEARELVEGEIAGEDNKKNMNMRRTRILTKRGKNVLETRNSNAGVSLYQ
jgi:hypothetical protein